MLSLPLQVNVPKTKKAFCKDKNCRKHTLHKVTQYKTGKASLYAQGEVSGSTVTSGWQLEQRNTAPHDSGTSAVESRTGQHSGTAAPLMLMSCCTQGAAAVTRLQLQLCCQQSRLLPAWCCLHAHDSLAGAAVTGDERCPCLLQGMLSDKLAQYCGGMTGMIAAVCREEAI